MIISLIIALLHSLTLGVKESQRGIDGNKEGGDDVRERERERAKHCGKSGSPLQCTLFKRRHYMYFKNVNNL